MEANRKQNFISVDKQTVINSYDEVYTVGETVLHEDKEAGNATILSFEPSESKNEVIVNTDKGYAHIDFLVKTK